MALDRLTKSKDGLLAAVKGLSAAQLNFKASPESWSIAECAEHIAISENMLFGMVEGSLKQPADPSKRAEVKMTDDQVLDPLSGNAVLSAIPVTVEVVGV